MWYYLYPQTDNVRNLPFYLYSIGLQDWQPQISRPKGFSHDQFFFFTSGSGTMTMDGKVYQLKEKNAFFIPAHVPHEYAPAKRIWDVRWMIPGGYALGDLYQILGLPSKGGVFTLQDAAPLDVIQNRMRLELIHDKKNGNLYASSLVNEYLMEFARQVQLTPSAQSEQDIYSRHMERLEDYIEYHFMNEITLQDLCDVVYLTPQHLCRVFKKCKNMRPMEYLRNRRIEAAKELLRTTGFSISEIAYLCGFVESNYFCRIFKAQENITPGQYRVQNL